MKKIWILCLVMLCTLCGCTDMKRQLEDHENRISRLEDWCQEMNTNLDALRTIVEALQESDQITSIVPVKKGGVVIGYTITFSQSEPITIFHGEKGEAGHSPQLEVKKDADGIYYWTLDGEWVLDDQGNKIRAEGKEGLTPEMKIEEGYWFVRYGDGDWIKLGKASIDVTMTGNDSVFKNVIIKGDEVIFVLKNGEELVLPRKVKGGVAMDPAVLTETSALFTGKAMMSAPDFEVGILYSTTEDVLVQTSSLVTTYELDSEKRFSMELKGLWPGTRYYYRIYTRFNDRKEYGDVLSFTTRKMAEGKALDLSAAGTANCYIVPEGGVYKFRTVKGNSQESVGEVASAEVLWETFGTSVRPEPGEVIVNKVSCDKDYITFMTAEKYHEGNAVIAAKDKQGKILWSWHIWLTDQPEEQVYAHEAGVMLDRNLGATSAKRESTGTLGLLYQWGRKDPFVGAAEPLKWEVAAYTGEWYGPVKPDEKIGTMEYAVAHPTTLIDFDWPSVDWLYRADKKGGEEKRSNSFPGERWRAEKTIYDPCPAGWRVPDGGAESVWAKAGIVELPKEENENPDNPEKPEKPEKPENHFDYEYHGWLFTHELVGGAEAWYPATGMIYAHTFDIWNFQSDAYYQTTLNEGKSYSYNLELYLENRGLLVLDALSAKANANPVRCQKILP